MLDAPSLTPGPGYGLVQALAPFDPRLLQTPGRLFPLLRAMAGSCERILGVPQPLVNLLFSLADDQALTGFCSYTVPLPLSRQLFGADCGPQAALSYVTERLANAAIGYEEILGALGLYGFNATFLFNYVELDAEDLDWLHEHVVNNLCEKPKTLLDLTLINSPRGCQLQINSRLPQDQAQAFLECFMELGVQP
ncbi:hypothetical protein OOJ96_24630 [Pseudomonas sp. 15FMM2]|uniref:Uncharacterized protein n=1 Tax=Pseudomonas imrae TaxID=2992837 RepID=A0ACC7PLQ9_9PSED